MKYTNVLNLPEPIVKAVEKDLYDKGEGADYSITELVDPPRKQTLEKKHAEDLVTDVSDEIFKLLGQSVHTILERAGVPERRFAITILGKTITGKFDRYKGGRLQDWKVTSAYRFKNGQAPFEVVAQLNGYAEIARQNGFPVEILEAVGILRDWSKLEVLRDKTKSYPRHQVVVVPVPIWTSEECIRYLEERVARHEAAKESLPECQDSERWARPEVWAVMKEKQVRAKRLFPNKPEAEAFIAKEKKPEGLSIVHRPGENIRCQSYCYAAPFCSQWREIQARTQTVVNSEGQE